MKQTNKNLLSFVDLKTHFSTNSARNFWVPRFKSMSAVGFHHSVLCHLLSPTRMGTGSHYGPAYTAEMVWLLAGVPGAMKVDWAPDGKDLHWADKRFHRSSKVSLSRVPAGFFSCLGKAFQIVRLYPEMLSQLINSTSGESVHPTLSQNQQSLCSGLATEKW